MRIYAGYASRISAAHAHAKAPAIHANTIQLCGRVCVCVFLEVRSLLLCADDNSGEMGVGLL